MGKKKSATARTTISVPLALKNRMEKAGEPVNWSAVAAVAFEQKLAEIAERRKKKTMSDVVERLRGSKRKSDVAEYKEGEVAGREWAMHYAEAAQLERLADLFHGLRGYEEDSFFESVGSAYCAAEGVFFVIESQCDKDREASRDFWISVLGEEGSEKIYRVEFVRGFVRGALDVWSEVRDQL